LFDELLKGLGAGFEVEVARQPCLHGDKRRRAVELLRDEMLGFTEAEKPSCRRILDDERRAFGCFLPADDEIVAKLRVSD
jgi:hypothetical protein